MGTCNKFEALRAAKEATLGVNLNQEAGDDVDSWSTMRNVVHLLRNFMNQVDQKKLSSQSTCAKSTSNFHHDSTTVSSPSLYLERYNTGHNLINFSALNHAICSKTF